MGMFSFSSKGSFKNTEDFLNAMSHGNIFALLSNYGQQGVSALASATPEDTGVTANSWYYKVTSDNGSHSVEWYNSNTNDGEQIAILIQFGHGTGTGGYVQGRDYINPAITHVFDEMVDAIWKEVESA